MSEPFLAEVRIVGFNFAPSGWAFCDGQVLPINQNQSLYSLLGTTYGGDGRTSFALPDLRGRVPIHVGRSNGGPFHPEGDRGGEETHTLATSEMPQHRHDQLKASSEIPNTESPGFWPLLAGARPYGSSVSSATMNAGNVGTVGGGRAHNNMQPYLAVNFLIALRGLFPSRS